MMLLWIIQIQMSFYKIWKNNQSLPMLGFAVEDSFISVLVETSCGLSVDRKLFSVAFPVMSNECPSFFSSKYIPCCGLQIIGWPLRYPYNH